MIWIKFIDMGLHFCVLLIGLLLHVCTSASIVYWICVFGQDLAGESGTNIAYSIH